MNTTEHRFFNDHRSGDPAEKALVTFIKRKNDMESFVEKKVNRIGYPHWNKTLSFKKTGTQKAGRLDSGDSVTIYYVPFVRDNQDFVNATLLLYTTPEDTSFAYLCDWQYADYGFTEQPDTADARDIFHLFTLLDRQVFGNRQYRITDKRLLSVADRQQLQQSGINPDTTDIIYHFREQVASGLSSQLTSLPVEQCEPYEFCATWSCEGTGGGDLPARGGQISIAESQPGCGVCFDGEICTTVMIEIGGSGDGGTTGGGEGGTTGAGGGWVPVGNDPGGSTPSDPVDTILSKYSGKFRQIGDSIYNNHSLPGNKEYFFAGARNNTTNDTAILNIRTDNDSSAVTPNLSTPGHYLLFIWHSHVSASQNTAERRSFSPADINYLRKPICLKLNFVSFADCGNKQYALVITDVAKAQAFFNANNLRLIEDNYTTTGGGNMQEVDERCVKNIIGSAAANGISFYVSTDAPGFTNWTLLNP